MPLHFTQVVIIGVGLIGGSLGMILRRKGLASSVVGVVASIRPQLNSVCSVCTA